MRIGDIMTKDVATIRDDTTADVAREKMHQRGIHHLVVLDAEKRVAGVLSERDLGGRRAAPRTDVLVRDLMSASPVTATATMTVRQAANRLRGLSIGCLPVMRESTLVGIVTITDLLELLGRGVEKAIAETERWTLKGRGARKHTPAGYQH